MHTSIILVQVELNSDLLNKSRNQVNTDGKLANEEATKTNLEGHNEEEKFKGLFLS
ncbi:hypothetical protein MTR_0695s0010 [Medicago truncatula]|uniref:Uncharacterized protein n=1 Tax=Medicago truncatula TaxID=3880 RepID=A0A072TF42_MEDTR|nr:hypothetical protein MTR_0695s0010 [Medicago truncatula]